MILRDFASCAGIKYALVDLHSRTRVVLPPIHKPLHHANHKDDEKDYNTVVHVATRSGQLGWKKEQHGRDENVGDAEQVGEPSQGGWEDERAVCRKLGAPSEDVYQDGDCV